MESHINDIINKYLDNYITQVSKKYRIDGIEEYMREYWNPANPVKQEIQEKESGCVYIFTKGKNKGKQCGKDGIVLGYCNTHGKYRKKPERVEYREAEKSELDMYKINDIKLLMSNITDTDKLSVRKLITTVLYQNENLPENRGLERVFTYIYIFIIDFLCWMFEHWYRHKGYKGVWNIEGIETVLKEKIVGEIPKYMISEGHKYESFTEKISKNPQKYYPKNIVQLYMDHFGIDDCILRNFIIGICDYLLTEICDLYPNHEKDEEIINLSKIINFSAPCL